MKIFWITPVSTQSAIARYSLNVTRKLQLQGVAVTIVCSERQGVPVDLLPFQANGMNVCDFSDLLSHPEAANDAILIGMFGDNANFHWGTVEMCRRFPVIGVFHDFYLLDLFLAEIAELEDKGGSSALALAVENLYGLDAWKSVSSHINTRNYYIATADVCPMTEHYAQLCIASIVHGKFYKQRAESCMLGATVCIPLTYEALDSALPRTHAKDTVKTVISTFGHANSNKLCDKVIEAIAYCNNPNALEYRIVGPIADDERRRLIAIADDLGFKSLTISGRVNDDELLNHMNETDLVTCLRFPFLEGASASTIEAMFAGKPVVVCRGGFYQDLPADAVLFVETEHVVAELSTVLNDLLFDSVKYTKIGERAAAYAQTRFTATSYVSELLVFLVKIMPDVNAIKTSDHYARQAQELGLTIEDCQAMNGLGNGLAILL